MELSNDLIAQFVKTTRDEPKKATEKIVYGKAVISDEKIYVQLDGSTLLTPATTTADVKDGERVTVLIKDHSAIVSGNITTPSASSASVKALGETIETNNVKVNGRLDAVEAQIGDLDVTGRLTAAEAEIDKLNAGTATIDDLNATNAEIDKLHSNMLSASDANITYAKISELDATNAEIDDLKANKLSAQDANITYAKISDLEATNGNITNLSSEVANIDTLIFGSASGNVIQTNFSNSVIAQLGDAQIKSAMIENVSADKIVAGDIITNNVRVKSEDGSLLISDETIQIKDDTRVRVQIGKDAANDYSINIWDQNGNLMFSKGGITDSAIKNAIIRNDMVSDTANISAHKLDIDSLFEEINGSTNTIKSTQIYLDDEKQTLNIAFKSLETDVTDLGETVSSQGTQITTVQGQIASKVWQQDINTAKNEMSTQYSTLEQEVDGITATVANHTTQISKKADSSTVTSVNNKVTNLETNLNGFQTTVSNTYATKTEVGNIEVGGRNLLLKSGEDYTNNSTTGNYGFWNLAIDTYNHGIVIEPDQDYVLSYDWSVDWGTCEKYAAYVGIGLGSIPGSYGKDIVHNTRIPNCDQDNTSGRFSYVFSASAATLDGHPYFAMRPIRCDSPTGLDGSKWVITNLKLEKGNKATDWTAAPEEIESQLSELETRVHNAETSISQNADAIDLRATKTEVSTAKSEAISTASVDATTKANNALNSANTNTANQLKSYSTTSEMNAAIELKANAITSSVSSTYATKTELSTTNTNVSNAQNAASAAKAAADAAQSDIDNLDIGGTNLLRNTSNVFKEYVLTADDYYVQFGTDTVLEAGQTYTFSVYVEKVNTDTVPINLHIGAGNQGNYNLDLYYWRKDNVPMGEKVSITYTVTEANISTYKYFAWRLRNEKKATTIRVKEVKLEKGNRATDWSPCPKDVESRVTSAESTITQLSNKITSNVTETNGLKTRMSTVEQTASGLTARLTTAESDIDTAQSTANTAKTNAANAAKTATNYLSYSTSGLVVGDMTTSTLGKNVLIDSDSVDIRNGTTTLASFGANTVTLGRNDQNSVIDLCDGAGRISANTSEAATSYPNRNAILIDSQEIETESVRFVATVSNKYGASSTPSIVRGSEVYLSRSNSTSTESCARLKAEHKTTSSGAYTNAGVSAMTYDSASTTRLLVYASDSANSTYNNINVYPTKTTMNKNLVLNGTTFTGANKVLWSGGYYMSDAQTCTLSEAISKQTNGIVLVWSYYTNGANDNSNFHSIFVPKHFVSVHNGKGLSMFLTNASLSIAAGKYVYISDTTIKGYSNNNANAAAKESGLTATPKNFVLRYVIGV